jgi:hypothetical protein
MDNFYNEVLNIYTKRIVSMMRDYKITLKKAIEWDMEGFSHHYNLNFDSHVVHYLLVNGITRQKDIYYYLKVLRGKSPDISYEELNQKSSK